MRKFLNWPIILRDHAESMEPLLRDALERAVREGNAEKIVSEIKISLATTLFFQRRMNEMREVVNEVLRDQPTNEFAIWFDMMLGFYLDEPWPSVWEKIDARWGVGMTGEEPILTEHLWDGSPLRGRSILLAGEGGLGDQIQFVRFAQSLKQAGAGRVVVSAPKTLHTLLQSAPGVDEVISGKDRERALLCDVSVAMMSSPRWLKMTLKNLPNEVPYLRIPESYVAAARGKIDRASAALHVGLCWHSAKNARRLPLSAFRPLMGIPGVRLYGLGLPSDIEAEMTGFPITGLACTDILSTAGAILELDLVITTDTMVTHLAGSLARPVWMHLQFVPDWRWGLTGDRTPWYPTIQLFREEKRGEMVTFEEMADQLRQRVGRRLAEPVSTKS